MYNQAEDVSPLQSSSTAEMSESEVDVKAIKGKVFRTVSRRSVETCGKRVVRRVVESPQGEQLGVVEDTVEEPVETQCRMLKRRVIGSDGQETTIDIPVTTSPHPANVMEEVEEDAGGAVVRRIIRREVPVVTKRHVYLSLIHI